jgi:glycosyltransferase involved in cell wall biosynthesis
MNILHINASDTSGGAARAAYRLHLALLREGIDSRMLVQRKFSDDVTVSGPQTMLKKVASRLRPFLDALPVRRYKERTKTLFSPARLPFSGIAERINELRPDIVHLHWICGGMLRFEELARIEAPIVWSLHDMWAFTGGCHYDQECGRYTTSCGRCVVLGSEREHDLSRKVLLRKQKTLHHCKNLMINGLSGWLARCAQQSALFKGRHVVNLPNPIDTELFKPVDKDFSRELLNLPKDKKIVLFGAMNSTGDPRKGFAELSQALSMLQSADVELVVFGSGKPLAPPDFGFPTHYLGHLSDDLSLKILYSAADVMVVPSLQEAFGQTASEAMACGTPVVAFAATGLLDIVDHKQNGYLAAPYEPSDLAAGIDWILTSPEYPLLCRNAREKVVREFDSSTVASKYIDLYKRILSERQGVATK